MRPGQRRGYTMVEVIVALGVLAVGAAGVIAIQKAAGVGNVNARNLASANRIAAKWAERLKLDAVRCSDTAGFADTYWLKQATAPPGTWHIPIEVPNFASPDADVLGADIFSASDPAAPAFCTNLRLVTLPASPRTVRAEIRVYWERNGTPADCSIAPSDAGAPEGRYGAVYEITGVTAPQ